ncbi:hypothetical protein C0431_02905 [bacterium]|nr:hypothetical protein [bacterium]
MQYFLYVRAIGLLTHSVPQNTERPLPCLIHHQDRVWDINPLAAEKHITIGMTLKEAKLILHGEAQILPLNTDQFRPCIAQLLHPCLKFSDHIQSTLPGEGFVDLTPHPEPLDIAGQLLGELHRTLQHPLLAGIAPACWIARESAQLCDLTLLSAHLLPITAVTNPKDYLAPKPITTLTILPPEDRTRLHQLGLDRIHQVQSTPLPRLESQFPKRGMLIHQAAHGNLRDSIKPNYPSPLISRTKPLGLTENAYEIDHALAELCRDLAAHLHRHDLQPQATTLTIIFESGHRSQAQRPLIKAESTSTQLLISLRQSLQTIPISEPIESICVQLLDLTSATRRQTQLIQSRTTAHLNPALNRIEATLGSGKIQIASQIELAYNAQVLKEWKRVTGWH